MYRNICINIFIYRSIYIYKDPALPRLNNSNIKSAERKEFEESDESALWRHNGVLRHST